MDNISMSLKSKNKQKKTVSTRIEEIENGFIIVREMEWQDSKKGWQYETKKYFSEKNPLADQEKTLADSFK